MRPDAPDPRTDREGDLDLLVDRGLVTAGAQAAMIVVVTQRFQRGVRVQHAAAARAQHVPGEIEQPEPGSMQKSGNHPLFVEPGPLRKIQHIDAVELVVLAVLDQFADGVRYRRIGGLLQYGKLRLGFTHE